MKCVINLKNGVLKMVNRFIVKANSTTKVFKNMEDACKNISKLEKLGYKCELWFRTIGLYHEHTYLLYTTLHKQDIKKQVQSMGLLI